MTYDAVPLLELARCETDQITAEALGVSLRTIRRWRAGGNVDHRMADELAIRIGSHPLLVWPHWS